MNDEQAGPERGAGPARSADEPEPKGIDLARRALEEARAAAKASGKAVGQGRASRGPLRPKRRRRGWSGPGPDDRDPQTLGSLAQSLSKQRGWSAHVSEGTVMGKLGAGRRRRHREPCPADHTARRDPARLGRVDRLGDPAADDAIADSRQDRRGRGARVVKELRITGPTAPSWRKGERHIRGRGPRDTYG